MHGVVPSSSSVLGVPVGRPSVSRRSSAPSQWQSSLQTASTPLKAHQLVQLARDTIPALRREAEATVDEKEEQEEEHGSDSDESDDGETRVRFATPSSSSSGTTSTHVPPSVRASTVDRFASRSSARWAASHTHLLASLSSLRVEVAEWEAAAFARVSAAEEALQASRAAEQAAAAAQQEAEETRQYFHNEFAARAVESIKSGGEGDGGVGAAPVLARRGTWNAGTSRTTDLSAGPASAGQSPLLGSFASRRASLTELGLRPTSASRVVSSVVSTAAPRQAPRVREKDAAALSELQSVMNNDVDERWMDTILDLTSPRKPTRRGGSKGSVDLVASPSRHATASNRPVSKVYSTLALEHRRALRRHPKIAKWLDKFWCVFERQLELEQSAPSPMILATTLAGRQQTSPTSADEVSPLSPASPPATTTTTTTTATVSASTLSAPVSSSLPLLSGRDLLALRGISKVEFCRFYHLFHVTLTGDAGVGLARSAQHDFERRCGARRSMKAEEFADALFELVDLWCLTHMPEDYVAILKAVYCRATRRAYEPRFGGMRTEWVDASEIGVTEAAAAAAAGAGGADSTATTSTFKVQPILTPAANELRRAQKRAARARKQKQAQYAQIAAAAAEGAGGGASPLESAAAAGAQARISDSDASSSEDDLDDVDTSDNSDADYQSDEEGANGGSSNQQAATPLKSGQPSAANLTSPAETTPIATSRLRAREAQFVGEALLALNDTVAAFHDDSALAIGARTGSSSSSGTFSLHSHQGLGYASRRKTIGLKWSVVSEIMEREIEKARETRDAHEKRKRDMARAAAATIAAAAATPNVATPAPSKVGGSTMAPSSSSSERRASLRLDGMVLGIHGRSPRRPSSISSVSGGGSGSGPHLAVPLTLVPPEDESEEADSQSARPTSRGTAARHLYASLDAGDSDLEDEEEARAAREARKTRIGHSWPSLARVLSLRKRTRGIEATWVGLVAEAISRKRRAEAEEAARREARRLKRLKREAAATARIAGLALKNSDANADHVTDTLETLASMSFVRGGDKAKARIAALLDEREREKAFEAAERAKHEASIAAKRAHLLADKEAAKARRKNATNQPGTTTTTTTTTTTSTGTTNTSASTSSAASAAASHSHDVGGGRSVDPWTMGSRSASSSLSGPSTSGNVLGFGSSSVAHAVPNLGRRVSWRDESGGAASSDAPNDLADVRGLPHPALAGEVRVSRAALAAREERERMAAATAAASVSGLTRAQRKAIVDAVVVRLTRAPACTNPAHNHAGGVRARIGVTEAGSTYPLDDEEMEYNADCRFDDASPTLIVSPPVGGAASAASSAPLSPVGHSGASSSFGFAANASPATQHLAHEAQRVATDLIDGGVNLPPRLAKYAGAHLTGVLVDAPNVGVASASGSSSVSAAASRRASGFGPSLEEALSSLASASSQPSSLHGEQVVGSAATTHEARARRRKSGTLASVAQRGDGLGASSASASASASASTSVSATVSRDASEDRLTGSARRWSERDRSSSGATTSGGGVPGHRLGSMSERASSPIEGAGSGSVSASSLAPPAAAGVAPRRHRRQRSRSAVSSPRRAGAGGGGAFFAASSSSGSEPVSASATTTTDDLHVASSPHLVSHARAALRTYLSADGAGDQRVHLPSVVGGTLKKGSALLPSLSGPGSGPASRNASAAASRSSSPAISVNTLAQRLGVAAPVKAFRGGAPVAISLPTHGGDSSGGATPITVPTPPAGSPNFLPRPLIPRGGAQMRPTTTASTQPIGRPRARTSVDDSMVGTRGTTTTGRGSVGGAPIPHHMEHAVVYHPSIASATGVRLHAAHNPPSASVGNSPALRPHTIAPSIAAHPPTLNLTGLSSASPLPSPLAASTLTLSFAPTAAPEQPRGPRGHVLSPRGAAAFRLAAGVMANKPPTPRDESAFWDAFS